MFVKKEFVAKCRAGKEGFWPVVLLWWKISVMLSRNQYMFLSVLEGSASQPTRAFLEPLAHLALLVSN